MLNDLNEWYLKYQGKWSQSMALSAEHEILEAEKQRIVRLLLSNAEGLEWLRRPGRTHVSNADPERAFLLISVFTQYHWQSLQTSYDDAQRATFAALLCLRLRLRLPRDLVQLICKDWVWPGRFEAWKRVS